MNQVCMLGRITKDVELKMLPNSETAVSNFPIAVDRKFQKKGEDRVTDFFPIVSFGKNAEFANNYFTKGMRIGVTGSLQNRSWKDKDGNTHTVTEILADGFDFADGKQENAGGKKATSSEEDEFVL